MTASPSVDNLRLGKGYLKWRAQGEATYRDLGELQNFETTLQSTTLPYWSERHGTRKLARTIVTQQQVACKFVLNEWTPENLAMALSGYIDTAGIIMIGSRSEIRGAIRYIGTNGIGEKLQVDFEDVLLTLDAALSMIGDDWSTLPFSGEVFFVDHLGAFGEAHVGTSGTEIVVS